MRIYVDTSAVAKLFIAERETPDLKRWLTEQPDPQLISSALLGVELIRLLGLVNPAMLNAADVFLADDIDIVEITPSVLGEATLVQPPRLRTLDAIHLATASDLDDAVDVLLTYDKLLVDAARAEGMTVASPGAA